MNFIHIPKTGGSSILAIEGWAEKIVHYGHNKAPNPSFAITRHPYDRLISAYVYLMNGGGQNEMDLGYQQILQGYSDFKNLVFNLECDDLTGRIVHLKPMHTFVCEGGKIVADHIFKLEDRMSINDFLATLGLGKMGRVNTTAWHYSDFLDWTVIGEINRVYRDDFKIFNYKSL